MRYEQVANAISDAIASSQISVGERLPTVRQTASMLGVSMTTVNSAYRLLAERGLIQGETGRGTFIRGNNGAETSRDQARLPRFVGGHLRKAGTVPWRRRALVNSAMRLRTRFPDAKDCSTGRPDPALLPLRILQRHWARAMDGVNSADLQYASVEPLEELSVQILARFEKDGIAAREGNLVIGDSAQQFLMLAAEVVAGLWGPENSVIAVEEPGYPTVFDTWERAGVRLIGVAVDEEGALPESLATALEAKAKAVLLTPRAHNPTGASWSRRRLAALADVLHEYRDVIAIEDDQFSGIAQQGPGSLLGDPRLEDRVLYLRSYSKSIAPDLRVAVAVARPRLANLMREAKSHADGWTSRLLQRVLAHVLRDPELDDWMERARNEYEIRRIRAANVINGSQSPGLSTWPGCDGANIWVHLPSSVDATEVIEHAAMGGVLVAPGEPFYVTPGHSDVIRFNAGSAGTDHVATYAEVLVRAVLASGSTHLSPIHV
ncbi:MAG TPA: PLP-dependent aminotransferase family protein [Bryobacteraceae bacterium]|nr:PLP-dependent aminotransferase family protein [Bryobacteraceae bacterium]